MSGTSLIYSFAEDMDDTVSSIINSGDSVQSFRSSASSPGPGGLKVGMHRPPGLGVSMPSPIGKPGHSHTSSVSTAQNLTLTPTSSLDGAELSYVRQSSPFYGDGRSLTSDPPGFGSFDDEDGDHDGLLGLQALPRDRALSHPGPIASYASSPTIRDDGRPMRPRTVSRDSGRSQSAASRPPLSGSAGMSPQFTESKTFYAGSGSRSRDHSPAPPAGVISRPGNSFEPVFDPRRRSIGSDNGRDYVPSVGQLTNQFGQLGNQPGFLQVQQHGYHQRASSMPGPMRLEGGPPDHYQDEMSQHTAARRGSDYGTGMYVSSEYSDYRYESQGAQYEHDPLGRAQLLSQRRSSMHNIPGINADFHGHTSSMHRRESLDFVPGHNRYPDGVPIVASTHDMRMYMNDDRYRSDRGPSYAGGHHRAPSIDMGSSTLSSSPASLSSTGMRGTPVHDTYGASSGYHRVTHSDEDLSHPLAGEHIDVPYDDRSFQHEGMRTRRPDPPLPQYGGGTVAAHTMAGPIVSLPISKVVYNIKFKRTQRVFVLGPRLNRELKIGTYVKVEADRGEDLGIVVGKIPSEKYMASRSGYRSEVNPAIGPPGGIVSGAPTDLKRIVRLATHNEVSLLLKKREEEDELLNICRVKVRQRGLNMNVVDAEYQFDRHKLTFFFEAEGRVDFRELVRDLFSIYKTRIWMQQLDKNTGAACPVAVDEPEVDDMDYGTPIIAPVSEYSDFTTRGTTTTD